MIVVGLILLVVGLVAKTANLTLPFDREIQI